MSSYVFLLLLSWLGGVTFFFNISKTRSVFSWCVLSAKTLPTRLSATRLGPSRFILFLTTCAPSLLPFFLWIEPIAFTRSSFSCSFYASVPWQRPLTMVASNSPFSFSNEKCSSFALNLGVYFSSYSQLPLHVWGWLEDPPKLFIHRPLPPHTRMMGLKIAFLTSPPSPPPAVGNGHLRLPQMPTFHRWDHGTVSFGPASPLFLSPPHFPSECKRFDSSPMAPTLVF